MSEGPEKKLLREIQRFAKLLGPRCWLYKLHAAGFSPAGAPDLLVVFMGETYLIELKAGAGELSPIQRHVAAKIEAAGSAVHVVRSVEEFKDVLAIERSGSAWRDDGGWETVAPSTNR